MCRILPGLIKSHGPDLEGLAKPPRPLTPIMGSSLLDLERKIAEAETFCEKELEKNRRVVEKIDEEKIKLTSGTG